MATIEIDYFNTFTLKKVVNASRYAVWPNITPDAPNGNDGFPGTADVAVGADHDANRKLNSILYL